MIVGYTMLHYGCDYLAYALRSLVDYVDKHVVIYSPTPTFGTQTPLSCPDSRDDLRAIADSVLGKKLVWLEGAQQNYWSVIAALPSTELILEVDADEVWPVQSIAAVLRSYRSNVIHPGSYRMPMQHFWRNFNCVCRDGSWPIRLWRAPSKRLGNLPEWGEPEPYWNFGGAHIHHFGYARALPDMRYKIETSAHKGEWRAGWWDDVFLKFPERLTDLHPVVEGLWNAEPYDKTRLPAFMRDHTWYDVKVIQ